jgi:hypothetical protein
MIGFGILASVSMLAGVALEGPSLQDRLILLSLALMLGAML